MDFHFLEREGNRIHGQSAEQNAGHTGIQRHGLCLLSSLVFWVSMSNPFILSGLCTDRIKWSSLLFTGVLYKEQQLGRKQGPQNIPGLCAMAQSMEIVIWSGF